MVKQSFQSNENVISKKTRDVSDLTSRLGWSRAILSWGGLSSSSSSQDHERILIFTFFFFALICRQDKTKKAHRVLSKRNDSGVYKRTAWTFFLCNSFSRHQSRKCPNFCNGSNSLVWYSKKSTDLWITIMNIHLHSTDWERVQWTRQRRPWFSFQRNRVMAPEFSNEGRLRFHNLNSRY